MLRTMLEIATRRWMLFAATLATFGLAACSQHSTGPALLARVQTKNSTEADPGMPEVVIRASRAPEQMGGPDSGDGIAGMAADHAASQCHGFVG